MYVLTLVGCDMVLGVYWSRTIRPILWNFADMTIEFYVEGNKVVLRA